MSESDDSNDWTHNRNIITGEKKCSECHQFRDEGDVFTCDAYGFVVGCCPLQPAICIDCVTAKYETYDDLRRVSRWLIIDQPTTTEVYCCEHCAGVAGHDMDEDTRVLYEDTDSNARLVF